MLVSSETKTLVDVATKTYKAAKKEDIDNLMAAMSKPRAVTHSSSDEIMKALTAAVPTISVNVDDVMSKMRAKDRAEQDKNIDNQMAQMRRNKHVKIKRDVDDFMLKPKNKSSSTASLVDTMMKTQGQTITQDEILIDSALKKSLQDNVNKNVIARLRNKLGPSVQINEDIINTILNAQTPTAEEIKAIVQSANTSAILKPIAFQFKTPEVPIGQLPQEVIDALKNLRTANPMSKVEIVKSVMAALPYEAVFNMGLTTVLSAATGPLIAPFAARLLMVGSKKIIAKVKQGDKLLTSKEEIFDLGQSLVGIGVNMGIEGMMPGLGLLSAQGYTMKAVNGLVRITINVAGTKGMEKVSLYFKGIMLPPPKNAPKMRRAAPPSGGGKGNKTSNAKTQAFIDIMSTTAVAAAAIMAQDTSMAAGLLGQAVSHGMSTESLQKIVQANILLEKGKLKENSFIKDVMRQAAQALVVEAINQGRTAYYSPKQQELGPKQNEEAPQQTKIEEKLQPPQLSQVELEAQEALQHIKDDIIATGRESKMDEIMYKDALMKSMPPGMLDGLMGGVVRDMIDAEVVEFTDTANKNRYEEQFNMNVNMRNIIKKTAIIADLGERTRVTTQILQQEAMKATLLKGEIVGAMVDNALDEYQTGEYNEAFQKEMSDYVKEIADLSLRRDHIARLFGREAQDLKLEHVYEYEKWLKTPEGQEAMKSPERRLGYSYQAMMAATALATGGGILGGVLKLLGVAAVQQGINAVSNADETAKNLRTLQAVTGIAAETSFLWQRMSRFGFHFATDTASQITKGAGSLISSGADTIIQKAIAQRMEQGSTAQEALKYISSGTKESTDFLTRMSADTIQSLADMTFDAITDKNNLQTMSDAAGLAAAGLELIADLQKNELKELTSVLGDIKRGVEFNPLRVAADMQGVAGGTTEEGLDRMLFGDYIADDYHSKLRRAAIKKRNE